MRVPLWTDISVGAVYGAMKRLAAEGLLKEAGREQEGNRPTRQIYAITEEGRRTLETLRSEGLSEVWFKPDPFDLALTRMDAKTQKKLPAIVSERLENVRARLAANRQIFEGLPAHVGLAKQWALRHTQYRLEAEATYLTDLLEAATGIVRDEQKRARK